MGQELCLMWWKTKKVIIVGVYKGSIKNMNTSDAFRTGELNRNEPLMVFDWDKAAKLIKEAGKDCVAAAGLENDWEWTGGTIYEDGEIVTNNDCYLASTWATPELEINGETVECFVYQKDKPEWDAGTMWCESALNILNKVE
jgi:hypothetical protein